MTPKVSGWDELHLAENPAVELLESLGYTYVPPEDLDLERGSFRAAILTSRLGAALKRFNPWLSEENVSKAVKAVTNLPAASLAEANQTLYTSLTYGISLEQDRGDGRKSHTVRFLDFDKPSRNEWVAILMSWPRSGTMTGGSTPPGPRRLLTGPSGRPRRP